MYSDHIEKPIVKKKKTKSNNNFKNNKQANRPYRALKEIKRQEAGGKRLWQYKHVYKISVARQFNRQM